MTQPNLRSGLDDRTANTLGKAPRREKFNFESMRPVHLYLQIGSPRSRGNDERHIS